MEDDGRDGGGRMRRKRTWIAPGRSGLQEETGLISSSLSVRQWATVSRESDGERRSGEKGRGRGGKNRCEKKRGKDRGREEQIGERGEDGGEEGRRREKNSFWEEENEGRRVHKSLNKPSSVVLFQG